VNNGRNAVLFEELEHQWKTLNIDYILKY
jgi:hypothetical protein